MTFAHRPIDARQASDGDLADWVLGQGYGSGTVTFQLASRLKAANTVLRVLVERVEMDEAVGVCLTSRVETLAALHHLAVAADPTLRAGDPGPSGPAGTPTLGAGEEEPGQAAASYYDAGDGKGFLRRETM